MSALGVSGSLKGFHGQKISESFRGAPEFSGGFNSVSGCPMGLGCFCNSL